MTAATDRGRVLVTVSLHHFRGGPCRLSSHATVSLLSAPTNGVPLKIAGNPATGKLAAHLPAQGMASVTFAWSNWCGSARAATINGVGPFGGGVLLRTVPPSCSGKSKPSRLVVSH